MAQSIRIKRTPIPDNAPTALADGELAVEVGSTVPRLWVGWAPATDGRRLIVGPELYPAIGAFLPLTGGTLSGPGNLVIEGQLDVNPSGRLHVTGGNSPGISLFNVSGGRAVGMWNSNFQLGFGPALANGQPETHWASFDQDGNLDVYNRLHATNTGERALFDGGANFGQVAWISSDLGDLGCHEIFTQHNINCGWDCTVTAGLNVGAYISVPTGYISDRLRVDTGIDFGVNQVAGWIDCTNGNAEFRGTTYINTLQVNNDARVFGRCEVGDFESHNNIVVTGGAPNNGWLETSGHIYCGWDMFVRASILVENEGRIYQNLNVGERGSDDQRAEFHRHLLVYRNFEVLGYCTVDDFRSQHNVFINDGWVQVNRGGGNDPFVGMDRVGTQSWRLRIDGRGYFLTETGGGAERMAIDPGTGYVKIDGHMEIAPVVGTFAGLAVHHGNCTKQGSGPWNDISDRRIKTDIRPYERGLAAIIRLNPVSYRFNGLDDASRDTTIVHHGLVAQDVLPIMPEMITETLGKLGEAETPLYLMNANALTYALVNAVKELATANAALETRVRVLEGRRPRH